MKLVKSIIVVALMVVIQTMFLSKHYWLKYIDLFLIMNIYFALHVNPVTCMGISVSSGFLQDAFSRGLMGMNAFSKTIVAFLISAISSRFVLKQPLLSIFVSLSTLLDFFIIYGLHGLFHLPEFPVDWKILIVAAILNSFTSLIGFYIGDRIRLKQEYA